MSQERTAPDQALVLAQAHSHALGETVARWQVDSIAIAADFKPIQLAIEQEAPAEATLPVPVEDGEVLKTPVPIAFAVAQRLEVR